MDARAMVPVLPLRTAHDVVAQLTELRLLELAIGRADDPDEHTVLLELTRISRANCSRFAAAAPGLLEWLADAYATGRGLVEAMAIVREGDETPEPVPHAGPLPCAVAIAALRIAGPAISTFLAGEHGCHVRHAMSGSTEVVRVRVYRGLSLAPAEHIARLAHARHRFIEALERGDPSLPDNPDSVPPIVRTYHFDGPHQDGPVPITITDHSLAHTLQRHVGNLRDALPTMWMLALDRDRVEAPK